MSNFWPNGLDLSDTQSPSEILRVAQEDWHQGSDGVMNLVLQEAESKSGNTMIIVHAKHVASNRTSTLFSVVHRPNNPYPVTIQLDTGNLPDFLKKTYTRPDYLRMAARTMEELSEGGQKVTNPWVSDTPTEFRRKLTEAFNEGSVKSIILNLASDSSVDTNVDHQEDQDEI